PDSAALHPGYTYKLKVNLMPISTLRIADFRNLIAVDISPCQQGLNVICGDNGSGKTSLLEVIYYLSLGKSFRSSTASRLINHTTDKFSIFSQLVNSQQIIPVGIERSARGAPKMRIAGEDAASIAELASLLPVRLIDVHSHDFFETGPQCRRQYLDWGLFYLFDAFLPTWRQYERVLKQRNAILRDKRPKKELAVWTEELVKHAKALDSMRREYVTLLTPLIVKALNELLPISNIEIKYLPGWDESLDFATILNDAYLDEYRTGYTLHGPHRADLEVNIDGVPVKHFLSRGQQKLLICAMIIAQGMALTQHVNKALIYLVDDLPAELDLAGRHKLMGLLAKQNTQIFMTAIEYSVIQPFIEDHIQDLPVKVFHVEHGCVTESAQSLDLGCV
ncbi:MAG: DNA replication/repair protein RecF, partial [Gammaproteobacteria bacterium]